MWLNQQPNSVTRFGAKVWNCLPLQVCKLLKTAFKRKIRDTLFAIFDAQEDAYVKAPSLLSI